MLTTIPSYGRPRCSRLCPGVRMPMTLINKKMVTCDWPQFEISLTQQISLIVLILFYHKQGNVTASVTHTPNLGSRPRSRHICSRVRLKVTLIVRDILANTWRQFWVSISHQVNWIIIMCFIIYNEIVNVNYNPILASRPIFRRLCPGVRM